MLPAKTGREEVKFKLALATLVPQLLVEFTVNSPEVNSTSGITVNALVPCPETYVRPVGRAH